MSDHRSALRSVCRLCCGRIQRRGIPKANLSKLVARAMSESIETDDDDVHPPFICELCDRKLSRWHQKCKQKKGGPQSGGNVNIELVQFTGHDDSCEVCSNDTTSQASSVCDLFVACRELAEKAGVSVVNRSSKLLLLLHDDDGNSKICLSVRESGEWSLRVYGQLIDISKTHLTIPEIIQKDDLPRILQDLTSCYSCPGNPEYILPQSVIENLPVYLHHQCSNSTVRHQGCPVVVPKEGRCGPCKVYRSDLAVSYKRFNTTNSPAPKTNYKYIKTPKLAKKLHIAKEENRVIGKKIEKLQKEINEMFDKEARKVKETDDLAFREVFNMESEAILPVFPDNSPQKLLWEEQKKSLNTNPHGMRWHPAILRLCIALCAKSSSAYELLRTSGFLTLPTKRNLRHYTHFTDNRPGFNKELLDRVCADLSLGSFKEYQRNIILAFDEMKVSQGLVYSHSSGDIIGFTDLGSLNNELKDFSKRCTDSTPSTCKEPQMASHVLVVMARAICHSYRCPIAYFATSGATKDELYSIAMEAIEHLETRTFRVRGIVCDGAAANRGLYTILSSPSLNNFSFPNPFTGLPIYLFCDVPHLLKTARNNLENSGFNQNTRNMKFRGLDISWQHILHVYEWDLGRPSSLRLLHRITEEHVRLSPAHRMKVKLAAQILSSTMSNALRTQKRPETESTRLFIEYMDTFFDCLNVTRPNAGTRSRKATLHPYKDQDDWRFTWLMEDLLSFLDEWETEANLVPLTAGEREKLHLSRQTMEGIRITVHSFVGLTRELLAEGVPYILSEKFSQDPLEEYFAKQRGMGGSHDNPSVSQFGSNMQTLQVAGSCIRGSKRANVTSTSTARSFDESPLPRKKLCKK